MIFRDQSFYDRIMKAQQRIEEYKSKSRVRTWRGQEVQSAKYDPGRLAIDMVLVPFIFDPATGKMEPTYVEKN